MNYDTFLQDLGFNPKQFHLNYPLAPLTHFKTGGKAEVFVKANSIEQLQGLLKALQDYPHIKKTVWGDASNVLVSDNGLKGFVLDLKSLKLDPEFNVKPGIHTFNAGSLTSDVAMFTAKLGFTGLQTFYGLPGTLGGACFMNASCYGANFASLFVEATCLNPEGDLVKITKKEEEWGYKLSPFQTNSLIMVTVNLHLPYTATTQSLMKEAEERKADRTAKGHFAHPCAGSTFKNNRDFGQPTGQLVDSLGLKGFTIGGAKVSPYHGNIIINYNNATSADILAVMNYVEQQVFENLGFQLEREVIYLE